MLFEFVLGGLKLFEFSVVAALGLLEQRVFYCYNFVFNFWDFELGVGKKVWMLFDLLFDVIYPVFLRAIKINLFIYIVFVDEDAQL